MNRGASVFLTTHDMLEADKLSNKVAFINKGKIVAMDTPHNLKQQYGKREIKLEIQSPVGSFSNREIIMDQPDTSNNVHDIFKNEKVVTIHSREATLEDIFIKITGRGLVG